MGPAKLYLWTLVYPSAWLIGLAAAWGAYLVAHPRPTPRCGGVVAEAWRVYAFTAAVPGLLLGMETYLWLFRFEYRAPLLATGLAGSSGLLLLAWAPVPVILAGCRGRLGDGRSLRRAGTLAAAGALLILAAPRGQARALAAVTAAAVRDDATAVAALARLEGYGYVDAAAAVAALDAALPGTPDVLALWRRSAAGEVVLDRPLRVWAAARLQRGLEAEAPVPWGDEAVAAVADLTADGPSVLAAYRAAHPDAPTPTAGDQAAAEALADHALGNAGPEAVAAVLAVAEGYVGRRPFGDDLVAALAAHVDDPEPVGPMAVRLLFRNGSTASLRLVLPRFLDPAAPEWRLLRAFCPNRTAELRGLADDPNPRVARAAAMVLGWVRRYCISAPPAAG